MNELIEERVRQETYIQKEYMTQETINMIKREQIECQYIIHQSGCGHIWKPDKLQIPRYSYLGQIISS